MTRQVSSHPTRLWAEESRSEGGELRPTGVGVGVGDPQPSFGHPIAFRKGSARVSTNNQSVTLSRHRI